ncbi:MAG: PilZ domain-containing protein, partial [Candidatus Hydrogenedentes bacterium]|nr:PilZ domain-containing protein [Candidatus Hydrogenedentota bacterium]
WPSSASAPPPQPPDAHARPIPPARSTPRAERVQEIEVVEIVHAGVAVEVGGRVVGEEGAEEARVNATVLDISGGGLAVMVPPDGTPFEPDREFRNCRINLPEVGTIETQMRVRSVFRISGKNGKPMLRAGCQFVQLPDSQVSMIQRFILRVERERNTRAR